MSQPWKSCDDFSTLSSSQKRSQLNELVKFFADKSGSLHTAAASTLYQEKLLLGGNHDEDDDILFTADLDTYLHVLQQHHTESILLTEIDYREIMDNLIALMQKFPDELLTSSSLASSTHYLIFLLVKESVTRIVKDLYCDNQQVVSDLSKILVSLDNFIKHTSQQPIAKLLESSQEALNLILLAVLNSLLIVNKYTNSNKSNNSSSVGDMERKCSEILMKIYDFIEKKLVVSLCSQSEAANNTTSRKMCTLTLYFITNVKDARSNVPMWKVLSKLVVMTKLFIQDSSSANKSAVSFLAKVFHKLCADISSNFAFVRISLEKLSQPSSSINGGNASSQRSNMMQSQTMLSSQMTFMNNALNDTSKVIKLSWFLLKIFRTFTHSFVDVLWSVEEDEESCWKVYSGLSNLLSLAGFILLYELKPREIVAVVETMTDDETDNGHQESWNENVTIFNKLKQMFANDISPVLEEVLQRLEKDSPRFQDYLVREDGFRKINMNQENELDWKRVQQNLLFQTILLNRMLLRSDSSSSWCLEQQYLLDFLHQIFIYIDTSLSLFSLPDYFSISESFASKFDYSSSSSTSAITTLHFYDLIRFNLLQSLIHQSKSSTTILYYLCNTLLIKPSLRHSFRIQMSQSLLVDYLELNLHHNDSSLSLSLLKLYSDFYELSSSEQSENLSFRAVIINSFRAILSSMTQMKAKRLIGQLEQYYTSKKYFLCYSLFFTDQLLHHNNQSSSDFVVSYMKHLVDFYSNLKSQDSVKTSQLALLSLSKNVNLASIETSSQIVNQLAVSLLDHIRGYLDRKLFNEAAGKTPARSTQILEATIPIYCKLVVRQSRYDDAELLLAHFLKSQFHSSLSMSLKFHLADMIFLLLNSPQRLPDSLTSRITDVLSHILSSSDSSSSSSSDQLRIYCLENLCESMTSASASVILRQLSKKNKLAHEQINEFLVETSLNMTPDQEREYLERKVSNSLCGMIKSSPPSSAKAEQCGQLDDTLSAIMDSSSQQPSDARSDYDDDDDEYDKTELRQDIEQALDNIELECDKLLKSVQAYKSKNPSHQLPIDLKVRFNSLIDRMSKF